MKPEYCDSFETSTLLNVTSSLCKFDVIFKVLYLPKFTPYFLLIVTSFNHAHNAACAPDQGEEEIRIRVTNGINFSCLLSAFVRSLILGLISFFFLCFPSHRLAILPRPRLFLFPRSARNLRALKLSQMGVALY